MLSLLLQHEALKASVEHGHILAKDGLKILDSFLRRVFHERRSGGRLGEILAELAGLRFAEIEGKRPGDRVRGVR